MAAAVGEAEAAEAAFLMPSVVAGTIALAVITASDQQWRAAASPAVAEAVSSLDSNGLLGRAKQKHN